SVVHSCMRRHIPSERNRPLVALRDCSPAYGRLGSKCEELKGSKASLQYPNDQTLFGRCEKISQTGQRTKSLRSSPLRGGRSREADRVESGPIASGEHHPENRGVINLTQNGALHEQDQHCQSAASTYDRRHDCAQAQPAYTAQPHLQLQAVG